MNSEATTVAGVEDIRQAYRVLLGREPDVSGLQYFSETAAKNRWDIAAVGVQLMRSEEFAIRHQLELPPVEVRFGNYSMFARRSDRDIGSHIAAGSPYEPHVTSIVQKILKPGHTFVDVGANIGYFTMLAADLVGSTGQVLAVEPLEKNLQLIYAGIVRNEFHHVDVMPFGASDSNGFVRMVTDAGTSNALVQSAPSGKRTAKYAPVRPLDWLTASLARIDLLKIDIEGHEIFAWRGGKAMFERCRPLVITEFHPHAMRENSAVDPNEYLDMLFDYGKTINVILGIDTCVQCMTPDAVMDQWGRSDLRYGGKGTSHLDLFVNPRG
jgi:FkbM family methyltransferase